MNQSLNSFRTKSTITVKGTRYTIFRLDQLRKGGLPDPARLPFSLRILLENLLRSEDGEMVKKEEIEALARWNPADQKQKKEISFMPARVLLQDFTGVPAVVDLAAMRDAVKKLGGKAAIINPLQRVDLVIDHSIQVDSFGKKDSFQTNVKLEFKRNKERYEFLKWGQKAFENFRVIPPNTGIIHQVNLEYLADVVFSKKEGDLQLAYPDTLVGTDSHTTMINGLGVLGWGVGGIEAEAVMLGQPVAMLIPEVVGFKLCGSLLDGVTATDLVLTVTQMLRQKKVVGKFVEFYGEGLDLLDVPNRATLANMAPEYGATAGFFPVDQVTLDFLKLSGRNAKLISLVETYAKKQGLFRTRKSPEPVFSDMVELDLGTVRPSLAGPKRPHDRIVLEEVKHSFRTFFAQEIGQNVETGTMSHGAVAIASITSCTNTSNPAVMMTAGLLAKKAVERGLSVKPWVKTSLAPGSKVVTEYLKKAGLLKPLERLKFNLVGFGCMTCIGNSGPLLEKVSREIKERKLVVASVLSGNRNFEGRIHPLVRANYLASPPLVVAYAIAGNIQIDLARDPIGKDKTGRVVYLRDIWPTEKEIQKSMRTLRSAMFKKEYARVEAGDQHWRSIQSPSGETFKWNPKSSYIKNPPFFINMEIQPAGLRDIKEARVLAVLGDSVTTDHISPAGSIAKDSPAGKYLIECGVRPEDFNSYGARRGNFEVMMRGTFANIRLRNLMVPGREGGWTKYVRAGEIMSIYDAAMKYGESKTPLIIIAGKEYGSGSSRDWAAKGPALLGVKAVIAESFERIHRSNLIGMGMLPLEFEAGENRETLAISGDEKFSILGINAMTPGAKLTVRMAGQNGEKEFRVISRIDAATELSYYQHGGILQYVLRNLLII